MDPLDKKEIGKRIKRLRKEKDLKQWQMADILGATQPAIHKYENGILPEVKRLLELARIGNTTIEWILTGRHWENGSETRERISREVCSLAERPDPDRGTRSPGKRHAPDPREDGAGSPRCRPPGAGALPARVRCGDP